MWRSKNVIVSAVTAGGLVVLFAVFIGFRHDAALIGALSAAGTVAAGGFAAVAALGSLRAAAESSAAARRTRESLAHSVQPQVRPTVSTGDAGTEGVVTCADGRAATDVTVVWFADGHDETTGRADRVTATEPLRTSLADAATVTMAWLEYADESRVGKWQTTWMMTDGELAQSQIQLVG